MFDIDVVNVTALDSTHVTVSSHSSENETCKTGSSVAKLFADVETLRRVIFVGACALNTHLALHFFDRIVETKKRSQPERSVPIQLAESISLSSKTYKFELHMSLRM